MKIAVFLPLVLVAVLVILGILVYPARDPIRIGERSTIDEQRSMMDILQQNTPVKFELISDSRNAMVITDPRQLYDLWSVLERLELRPEAAVVEGGYTEGIMQFFDGSERRYRISDGLQLDGFLRSLEEDPQDAPDLFTTLMYALQTKETVMDAVRQAGHIHGYTADWSSASADPQDVLQVTDHDRRLLLDRLAQSERLIDTAELQSFLAIYGDNPFYYIVLPVNHGSAEQELILSVLSYSYFYVTDVRYQHASGIFFRGNLLQFMEERLF